MLAALTIKTRHSDVFTFLGGNLERSAGRCDVPGRSSIASLVYVSEPAQLAEVMRRNPAILVVQAGLACQAADDGTCCFSVRSIPMGMAVLLKYFDRKSVRFTQWGERHATAVVHADASIGAGVFLGPYCVIGANASIGDGCLIGAHAVVENEARIGTGTVIHPHTTIGSDGFGYAAGADGMALKITHLGNVEIGDDVEIGGNCAIDRATLTSTHIRSRTKIDNVCHIAHNCDLGEDGFFTAGFMMGGSTKIGRRFVTGGNTVVTAHVTIADDVTLQGRSSVTNDIPEAGAYGGYPLQPLKEAMKTTVSLGHLNEIRKNLRRVLKHLHLTDRCIAEKAPDISKS